MVEQTVADLAGLIYAIAGLIGALVPIAISILAFIKTHTNRQDIQKIVNVSEQAVNSLQETDKWVLDHQAQITKIVEVASKDPNFKKWLEEKNLDVNKMKLDLENTTKEIQDLYSPPKQPTATNADPIDRKIEEIDKKTKVTPSVSPS
jgi:hypothetical protein